MEYYIWCDESLKKGKKYSNFYGGALVQSSDIDEVIHSLERKKRELNLFGEVKWTKVSENYEKKYIELISLFFYFIKNSKIKVRVMFTDNALVPQELTKEQKENEYFLLYYQFVKHAFGFTAISHQSKTKLRIFFDKIPDKKIKADIFKEYIYSLNNTFLMSNISIPKEGIGEVKSHDHVVLQCLDIVLGSIAFRLNNMHLEKIPGSRFRGKKTKAKERVYKHIIKEIKFIYPDYAFNIGISTGIPHGYSDRWHMPYRHWRFRAKNSICDMEQRK